MSERVMLPRRICSCDLFLLSICDPSTHVDRPLQSWRVVSTLGSFQNFMRNSAPALCVSFGLHFRASGLGVNYEVRYLVPGLDIRPADILVYPRASPATRGPELCKKAMFLNIVFFLSKTFERFGLAQTVKTRLETMLPVLSKQW